MNATRATSVELAKRELLQKAEGLVSKDTDNVLGLALKHFFPEIARAFVLYWLPEQGEDIYWLLVGPQKVAKIEIPRGSSGGECASMLEILTVEEYKSRKLSRITRRKLDAALALI